MLISSRKEMELYSWASLLMGLKLELVGMKVSRGVNVMKQAQQALNVKTKDRKELLAMVETKIAEMKAELAKA